MSSIGLRWHFLYILMITLLIETFKYRGHLAAIIRRCHNSLLGCLVASKEGISQVSLLLFLYDQRLDASKWRFPVKPEDNFRGRL